MYRKFAKRAIDLSISLISLLVLSPILFLIVLGLFIFNSGKPFFYQKRPGLNGKVFTIIKLKTMNDKKNRSGELLPDSDRLTWIGRIVRKLSIDEFPQLINVVKGEMSLIGPRPLLVEYLPLYNDDQARRHEVRPGITGWAQVNGRNALNWQRKFELDVWYVDHLSFGLDVRIMLQTVRKVFKREGIDSGSSVTMEKFTGNQL